MATRKPASRMQTRTRTVHFRRGPGASVPGHARPGADERALEAMKRLPDCAEAK